DSLPDAAPATAGTGRVDTNVAILQESHLPGVSVSAVSVPAVPVSAVPAVPPARPSKIQAMKPNPVMKVAQATVRDPPPAPAKVASAAPQAQRPTTAPTSTDDGDGLYVVVLATHKDAAEARQNFAELQKQYVSILGSKQGEVQVVAGQTG